LILVCLVGAPVSFVHANDGATGFSIEKKTLQKPRPLKICVLKVDLKNPGMEVAVAVVADPDGNGPAESALMNPVELAKQGRFQVAVNANAWGMIPAVPAGESPSYNLGGHCDIVGLAVVDQVVRSGEVPSSWSLWQDQAGGWHAEMFTSGQSARQAISGFGPLLKEGQVAVQESDILHPRTAVGLDERAQQLIFVVVDGRQPGVSEGMSEQELAVFMKSLGCWNALNLDGGGSSVLVKGASPRIVNTPSGGGIPRPVPVMIGIRAVKKTQASFANLADTTNR